VPCALQSDRQFVIELDCKYRPISYQANKELKWSLNSHAMLPNVLLFDKQAQLESSVSLCKSGSVWIPKTLDGASTPRSSSMLWWNMHCDISGAWFLISRTPESKGEFRSNRANDSPIDVYKV
jgi:hypothetical protein